MTMAKGGAPISDTPLFGNHVDWIPDQVRDDGLMGPSIDALRTDVDGRELVLDAVLTGQMARADGYEDDARVL